MTVMMTIRKMTRGFKIASPGSVKFALILLGFWFLFAALPLEAKSLLDDMPTPVTSSPSETTSKPKAKSAPESEPNLLESGTESTTLSTGTESTTLSTGTSSTTLSTGTASTTLSTGTGSTTLQAGTTGTTLKVRAKKTQKPTTILFLLDASLSMKEKIGRDKHGNKIQKIDAAKQVLQQAMMKIPAGVDIGLRVFGHFGGMDGCRATALLVPPGKGNRASIIRRVRPIRPTGLTPLTFALFQAAESDLRRARGRKTIILITDGVDTCGLDPCAYIKTLKFKGIDLKVDIVGLDIRRDFAKKKLDCIAKNSGGKYYDADTAAKLIDSVSNSVSRAISGQVITGGGDSGANITNPLTPAELIPIVPMDSFDPKSAPEAKNKGGK